MPVTHCATTKSALIRKLASTVLQDLVASKLKQFILQRMDIVASNPCDKLERPRTSTPPARGLSAVEIRRLLTVIPETPQGLRDRAIVLTLLLTGRRREEVFQMTVGDLSFEKDVCF